MKNQYNICICAINKFRKTSKTDNVVICGLSVKAKDIIKSKLLPINYILDNNKNFHNSLYSNIKILSENELVDIKNPTFIILATAHTKSFCSQIINLNIKCKIFIEYAPYALSTLLSDYSFLLETPTYDHSYRIYTKVPPLIFKNIVSFNKPIKTITNMHSYKGHFTKRKPKKYQMLFSFHSIGKEKFNIFRYKEGYLNDTITYDTEGYSGFASKIHTKDVKKISLERAKKDFKFYEDKYIKQNLSKYIQPSIQNITLPKDYVFFATQTVHDTVMKLSYFEPLKLIQSLIDKFSKQKNISLVIKRHPECNSKEMANILKQASKYDNIYIINASIHTLITNAKAVYTINSGVGFEALLHLKPVVLFGKSDYETACFICKNIEKLNLIPKLNAKKADYIKQFISYYMSKRNFIIDDKLAVKKVIDKSLMKFFKYHLQKEFKCKVKIYM